MQGAVAAVNVVQLRGFALIVHSRSKNVLVVLRGMGCLGRLEVIVVPLVWRIVDASFHVARHGT